MADKSRSSYASPFDDMLDENKRKFDELFRSGSRSAPLASRSTLSSGTPKAPSPAPRPEGSGSARRPRREPDPFVPPSVARFLDDRYGDDWHYEIEERRREGNEVIVLCKLVIDRDGTSKSQFGRARIASPGEQTGVSGRMNGVRFSFGSGKTSGVGADPDPEDKAFREALGAALAKCVDML